MVGVPRTGNLAMYVDSHMRSFIYSGRADNVICDLEILDPRHA